MSDLTIRRATEDDAAAVAGVIAKVAAERIYSAIDSAFTVDEEREYIASLSAREAVFVAERAQGEIVGIQTLEAWARTIASMRHVAQIGTFLPDTLRRQGIGTRLFAHTSAFPRTAGFEKLIIQVRASNAPALTFYEKLGFHPAGRLRKQVIIDGVADDELFFELFL